MSNRELVMFPVRSNDAREITPLAGMMGLDLLEQLTTIRVQGRIHLRVVDAGPHR